MAPDNARHLLRLVNDPAVFDMLLEYANQRMEWVKSQLTSTNSWEESIRLQGQYRELLRIRSLRDEVNQGAKDGRKD